VLIIDCPYCGQRESAEFSYGGDASVTRPPDPEAVSDAEWTTYLFMRDNPKGPHLEHWFHRDGCRGWLKVTRSTVTQDIAAVSAARPESSRS
jgi:heterotetrameric sarcosine oxidase delta subunit